MKIITALQVKLTEGELARVYSKGTKNLDAYLKIMEANWLVLQGSKDGLLKARNLAEEAIALDQNYPFAYRILGGTHAGAIWYGLSKNPTESLSRAVELMRKAVELDDSSAILHASLGFWLTFAGEYDTGIKEGEMALLLEPGSYEILRVHGSILTFAGRPEEAIPLFNEALRLDPKPSNALLRYFAVALRDSGKYEEAITQAKRATEQEPNDLTANVALASSLSLAGREEEARAVAGKVLKINPKFSISQWEKLSPHKDRIVVKRYCDALRKVGLPD
jgi:adenylate cyclase